MAEPRWTEVSLRVDPELSEAVAEVLNRFAPGGVVIERAVDFDDDDEGTPSGPARVFAYLPLDERDTERRRALEEALWHLGQIEPLPAAEYRPVADENWMESWKTHYRPVPIGQRLEILPSWIPKGELGRIPVRIDPGMAFGTGEHPSTQLCLELLEGTLRPGEQVIDLGCGSGILSIAALKLGSGHVLAVDVDPAAVKNTRENAALNGVGGVLTVGEGSVGELLEGKWETRNAPLVLCNILAKVILALFDEGLAELATPQGRLILAGMLENQAPAVEEACRTHGLSVVERRQRGEWVALLAERDSSRASSSGERI